MRSLNLVVLVGIVGRVMEFRPSRKEGGKGYCALSMATNERYGDGKTRVDWHTVYSWGATAEFIRDRVTKGSLIQVTGKLRTSITNSPEKGFRKYITVETRDIVILVKKDPAAAQESPTEEPPAEEEGEN